MSGPVMHASIERKFNLGNYQTKSITVGISQVPLHATDAMIADMLKTSARVVEALDGVQTVDDVLGSSGVDPSRWPSFRRALGTLVASQMLVAGGERAA